MNVRLHIERLIFDGIDIPPYQRPALHAAVEAELARLITEQRDPHEVRAARITPQLPAGPAPAQLSAHIARQVYAVLQHEVPWPALRRTTSPDSAALPSNVNEALNTPGQPLQGKTRAAMEARFGRDLSDVRLHTDEEAARAAHALHARALTVGREVLLAGGQGNANATEAHSLLAHEIAHTVQQDFGRVGAGEIEFVAHDSVYEREAQEIGHNARRGILNSPPMFTRAATLQLAAEKRPAGWDEIHNYKHPGNVTVRLTVFKTTGMTKDFTRRYIDKAKAMLKDHGLGLDVYTHSTPLQWTEPLQTIDQVLELRMLAHKAYQDTRPRLPVIFAPMHYSVHSTAQTYSKTDWLPFVVINSEEESQDGVTLLHEMGHAANVPGRVDAPVGKDDVVHNFMEYGDDRNDMHKKQVIAIAESYFAK